MNSRSPIGWRNKRPSALNAKPHRICSDNVSPPTRASNERALARSAARGHAGLRFGFDGEQCKWGNRDLSCRICWSTAEDDGKIAPEVVEAG
jgi:hypothetical protein